ncbi:1-deoxy-D-xylulose-5-phosphate synthase [Pricia sp. S334]|uniref:1-deoxy-D-xylulose-5-phosphate synthase n=1 Tax=Pricia mediterranea TaxID=3076079 RepID=A0ABU3L5U9_9FLAO|nr:1-deoxy-D-xylulose-5-phosphate synthase [Pricia sp. S334]MDT7829116.1 1-deoxy-D-xylulose-5-phosphate synthase [Pricia sp. S334]
MSHFSDRIQFYPLKNLLEHISSPDELRRLDPDDLPRLAKETRGFIIDIVATKEGHLGASLGTVELTIALHYVFDTPDDKLIWDVGHQAYGHKILTGRKSIFDTNRQLGGISGFPRRTESEYDAFGTGHSSTSISAILGMAIASRLQENTERQHIAVIGDASIASGMAFEALNHLGSTDANVLVILNDNAIGIDPSVGALKKYLTNVKKGTAKEENIFECLNLAYTGPIDGHDISQLLPELERLKSVRGPRLLHVITTKGKGLEKAEIDQVTYHAPGRFDRFSGEREPSTDNELPLKYQDVFGHTLVELAENNPKITGITPAMPTGSSLKYMMAEFPKRAFDVGIAEQHAVTLAAGMATQGLMPFCVIYSTFLQRAYDQVIHDVALQNLPVIFCIDRAGIVGQDGATHNGIYDMAYLRCIPNLVLFAPMNETELRNGMFTAQLGLPHPIAIRYPRGRGVQQEWRTTFETIEIGSSRELRKGSKIAILSIGHIGNSIAEAIEAFEAGQIGHYDMRFVKPLDKKRLYTIFEHYDFVISIEDGCKAGGFGSAVLEIANEMGHANKLIIMGIDDLFLEHGTAGEVRHLAKIDAEALKNRIKILLDE